MSQFRLGAVATALVALAVTAHALVFDCRTLPEATFAEGAYLADVSARDAAMTGDLALLASADRIEIHDASDPVAPVLLAVWQPSEGTIARVTAAGDLAAVVLTDGTVYVLDLADPAAPIAAPVGDPLPTPVRLVAMAGNRLAAVTGDRTLHLLQLSASAAPAVVWTTTLAQIVAGVALTPTNAYVVGQYLGLVTLDAGDDTPEPTHALAPPSDSQWYDVAVVGESLLIEEEYVRWIDTGGGLEPFPERRLRACSIADPALPVLGGTTLLPASNYPALCACGPLGLVWNGASLVAVRLEGGTPPAIEGTLSRTQTVTALATGLRAAAAVTAGGFRLYAVANPRTLAPRRWFRQELIYGGFTRHAGGDRYVVEGLSYHWGFSGWQGWAASLQAYDLADDSAVTIFYVQSTTDYLETPEPLVVAEGFGPGDDRVYFRWTDGTIWVSPIEGSALYHALPASGEFAASGVWAFVATADTLFRINCSNTSAPYVASAHPLEAQPTCLYSPFGSTLIAGYASGRVDVYYWGAGMDLETFQVGGPVRSLAVDAELILVGTDDAVEAIDYFEIVYPDKDHGDVLHLLDTELPVTSLVANGGYVYAAQGQLGARMALVTGVGTQVLDLGYSGPPVDRLYGVWGESSDFGLLGTSLNLGIAMAAHCALEVGVPDVPPGLALSVAAAPNPFNPRTTVTFTLARAQTARLDLFDLCGRRVRTLAEGSFAAGSHAVTWDGRDHAGRGCATGVYLARVRGEAGTAQVKLTLLR